MARNYARSITLPIILGSAAVALTITMLVGWIIVSIQNVQLTREVATQNVWLLIAGIVSFVTIMSVTVMLMVFLVREILEVRRQHTFIDSVTHELKSPLASLKLCVETLGRAELSGAQRDELRQMMIGDVDRLSEFIEDVLEASRIVHGGRGLLVGETTLEVLVERCIAAVVRRYKLPPNAVKVALLEGVTLRTDVTAVETVVKNLLDNAVKYSSDPVDVLVTAERETGGVVLTVRDRGIGIPKQHLKRIFERFYRVPGEDVYMRRGTGLGLYVAASLARSLGGRLEARSEGRGKGAELSVHLPSAEAP